MRFLTDKIKKNLRRVVVYSLFLVILFYLYTFLLNTYLSDIEKYSKVTLIYKTELNTNFQIFYDAEMQDESFEETNSIVFETKGTNEFKRLDLVIPVKRITKIRLDIGDSINSTVSIRTFTISGYGYKVNMLSNTTYAKINYHDVEVKGINNRIIELSTIGTDPFIYFENLNENYNTSNTNYILSTVFSLITLFILYKYISLKLIYNLCLSLFNDRKLILSLARNDFKTKYAGSYFGIIWAFIQPIMTILVFWFVFQIGFRTAPVKDVPFVLWFMCGLIPWFFFSDAWNSATNCFLEYSYLVKKISFRVAILPLIKIISSLFVHIIFVIFMVGIFALCGIFPNIKMTQLIYFSFSAFVLIVGLSLITSSVVVFFKDISQIITIILQFGMWLTPIMWSIDMIPVKYMWIFKLNPMYYIVMGYRDTMISNEWFFVNIKQTFYFWLITFIIFLIGAYILKKTRPHFADVL